MGLKRRLRCVILAVNATSGCNVESLETETQKQTNKQSYHMENNRYCPITSFLPRKFSLYSIKKQYKTKHKIKLKDNNK